MLYQKNGEWALPLHKVIYKQHGETLEQYTHDNKWWNVFAEKWDHTEIVEFEDVTYSDEELERLEEIKPYIKEGFEYYAWQYIIDNLFLDEFEEGIKKHLFEILKLQKEKERLEGSVMELTTMLAGGYNV